VSRPRVGVLALQGDVREHAQALERCGARTVAVRSPADLRGLAGIVLPGGESTTVSMLLVREGLAQPLAGELRAGLPALATCAGLIVLARQVLDGRPDQHVCGVLDVVVRRNAFGRQVASFERPVDIAVLGPVAFPGVFIRAPWLESVGPQVEVLAHVADADGHPRAVMVRQGAVIGTSFHPELTADDRVHALLLGRCTAPSGTSTGAGAAGAAAPQVPAAAVPLGVG